MNAKKKEKAMWGIIYGLQGFHKIVPDRWEFGHEDFVKGQKHRLNHIQRKKTGGGGVVVSIPNANANAIAIANANSAHVNRAQHPVMAEELEFEKLHWEKNLLMLELGRLSGQQSFARHEIRCIADRLRASEMRQEKIMSFVAASSMCLSATYNNNNNNEAPHAFCSGGGGVRDFRDFRDLELLREEGPRIAPRGEKRLRLCSQLDWSEVSPYKWENIDKDRDIVIVDTELEPEPDDDEDAAFGKERYTHGFVDHHHHHHHHHHHQGEDHASFVEDIGTPTASDSIDMEFSLGHRNAGHETADQSLVPALHDVMNPGNNNNNNNKYDATMLMNVEDVIARGKNVDSSDCDSQTDLNRLPGGMRNELGFLPVGPSNTNRTCEESSSKCDPMIGSSRVGPSVENQDTKADPSMDNLDSEMFWEYLLGPTNVNKHNVGFK